MSTNTIFDKIVEATTSYSLLDLKKVTYKDMITKFDLTKKEIVNIGPYHSGIKKRLVHNVELTNIEETKSEMINKLLLSGSNISAEEAQLAVEKIFGERSK